MAEVHIQNAQKTYGKVNVLHDISLDVADGEFLVLVGPSGCGKSTLLRMIAGLESVTEGDILIDDKNVTDLPPKARDIAMVFQNYALYPHMSVERNMGFSLEIAHESKEIRKQKVRASAEILGLTPLLDRYPRQLSGGQRQRVAMGRAIVRDPAVFLFDEPLSNLDAQLRVEMRTEIKSLHERLDATIVYVTHDQVEAMTMADRIAVMNKGIIEQIGSPLELYEHPANTFVAKFIGSPPMNLIKGKVEANADGIAVHTEAGDLIPVGQAYSTDLHGREVLFGIRPEDLHLDEKGFAAQVVSIEPTGSETLVQCKHGQSVVSILLRQRETVQRASTVRLSAAAERMHLFAADSGEAIKANQVNGLRLAN